MSGRGILILSTAGRLAVSHAKIFVGSSIHEIGRGDRTETISLVPSSRVCGAMVGSSMLIFESGDRTEVSSGPGDRTEKTFLVGSPHQKIRHGDRTKICRGARIPAAAAFRLSSFPACLEVAVIVASHSLLCHGIRIQTSLDSWRVCSTLCYCIVFG